MAFAEQMRVIALPTAALLVLGTAGASAASKLGTNQIKNGAVTSSKIKNNAVTSSKVKNGVFEFTTLTYEPVPGAQGWTTYSDIQNDPHWYLTGDDGTATNCTPATMCTLVDLVGRSDSHGDPDPDLPAISSGLYFGLGSGLPAATTAVDKFVFNSYTFDFEPTGVFMTTS